MKKNKQFPAAMILLAVVSAVCYKGMRAIENKLKAKKREVSEMRLLPSFVKLHEWLDKNFYAGVKCHRRLIPYRICRIFTKEHP